MWKKSSKSNLRTPPSGKVVKNPQMMQMIGLIRPMLIIIWNCILGNVFLRLSIRSSWIHFHFHFHFPQFGHYHEENISAVSASFKKIKQLRRATISRDGRDLPCLFLKIEKNCPDFEKLPCFKSILEKKHEHVFLRCPSFVCLSYIKCLSKCPYSKKPILPKFLIWRL